MNDNDVTANNYVMVVEDDEFYAKIFLAKIAEAGLPVKSFVMADEALTFATLTPPKIIVCDLVMPRMDGFKFIEKVKTIVQLKNIPILVFSNLGQEKDIAEAKRLGATDYVVKSEVSLSDAIATIAEYYEKGV